MTSVRRDLFLIGNACVSLSIDMGGTANMYTIMCEMSKKFTCRLLSKNV